MNKENYFISPIPPSVRDKKMKINYLHSCNEEPLNLWKLLPSDFFAFFLNGEFLTKKVQITYFSLNSHCYFYSWSGG